MNDIVSNDEEWEESDYENPPNTTTNSSFKPYLNTYEKDDIEKEDERSQKKRKGNKSDLEINNEQPNKRVYKANKFEAIKYSLGPNEEYIAIKRCEYNAWERNKDNNLAGKEVKKVGEVLIIWNPMCVVVMLVHVVEEYGRLHEELKLKRRNNSNSELPDTCSLFWS
ncbi:hypothetical protein Tco_0352904 [Tanacetum coccineum]